MRRGEAFLFGVTNITVIVAGLRHAVPDTLVVHTHREAGGTTYQGVLGRHIYTRVYIPGCTREAYSPVYTQGGVPGQRFVQNC